MKTGPQALCWLFSCTSLFQMSAATAQAQNLDVENEHFPGAKRVKVEVFGGGPIGFWAEYKLDKQGWATESRTYFRRRLISASHYSFTNRRKLQQERVITSQDKRIQIFRYSYQYTPDSTRILRETGFSDADTMFVFHYLKFNLDNQPIKFIKSKGLRREVAEVTELTYINNHVATYRLTDYQQQDSIVYTFAYQYNNRGDLIKESRMMQPKPAGMNWWLDNRGDEPEYSYDYSAQGPWIRQYQLYKGRKVLISRRTVTY